MPWHLPYRRLSILGFGQTGQALVATLAPRGLRLFVSEQRTLAQKERALLEAHGVQFEEGGHTDKVLDADLIVPSPGVPPRRPPLPEAHIHHVPVWSELELAFRLAQPSLLVAVTGTNGKSTTTELVGAILRAGGLRPVVAGNIGKPAIATTEEVRGQPWVLEVSSYQLEWTQEFRPQVAVWLNFAPDHLDHHGHLAAYFAAKARILARQAEGDWAILPPELLGELAPRARTRNYREEILPPGWGKGLPPHLEDDLRAAWAAVRSAFPELARRPPPYARVAPALAQPHRMEKVGVWRGIPFVDDSKGTNAHATIAALRAIPGPAVLILGGRHKGGGYQALAPVVREKVRACILIGESQEFFARLLEGWGVPFAMAWSPYQAVKLAYAKARRGDTVLLSPACASFDQFRDYAHRGEAFRRAFARLSQG